MRVLEYQMKEKKPDYNFKKMFDSFINKKGLNRKVSHFTLSDYDSIVKQIERIKNDPSEKKDLLRLIIATIEQEIPPSDEGSILMQGRKIEPSDFEKAKLVRVINVLSDPLIIFDLAKKEQLGFMELEVLGDYMPELYQEITEAAIESVTDYLSTHALTELPREITSQLTRFLGLPEISPETMIRIQQNYKNGRQNEQPEATGNKPGTKAKPGKFDMDISKIATANTKIAHDLGKEE